MPTPANNPRSDLQDRRWFRGTNAVATLVLAAAFLWEVSAGLEGEPAVFARALLVAGAVVVIICNVALLVEWAWERRARGGRRS